MERPAAYTVKTSQRSLSRVSGRLYHLMADQRVRVVKKLDMAYTSPSTAENHTDVAKAAVRPATIPAVARAICAPVSSSSASRPTRAILPRIIVDHATNMAAKAVQIEDMRLTAKAIFSGLSERISPIQANIRPTIRKRGAPGGWTTCSLYAPSINSPQSQSEPDLSAEKKYTMRATANTSHPDRFTCFLKSNIRKLLKWKSFDMDEIVHIFRKI